MKKCQTAFKEQFNLASFYAYMKMREQELRNLMWIMRYCSGPKASYFRWTGQCYERLNRTSSTSDAERNGRALDSNFITFVHKSTKEAHDRFGCPMSFRDNEEQLSELSASARAVHGTSSDKFLNDILGERRIFGAK